MAQFSLSYDHRVIDDGLGRRLMAALMEKFEEPVAFLSGVARRARRTRHFVSQPRVHTRPRDGHGGSCPKPATGDWKLATGRRPRTGISGF
ncbi:MAG TPA: hypothetical protein ENH00_12950 [Actinobacteria bacterium]|nr:hypothetical protein [Actinomycetota bacterium]